jgi:hypothetical protein
MYCIESSKIPKEERVIIRRKKDRDFTIVGNSIAQDSSLSWKSRGLFLYLYSLPVDWGIHENELLNHSPDGRRATHAAFEELIQAGYIFKAQGENIYSQTYFFVDDEHHSPEEWEPIIKTEISRSPDLYKPLVQNVQSLSRKCTKPLVQNVQIQSTQTKYPKKETDKESEEFFFGSSKTSAERNTAVFSEPETPFMGEIAEAAKISPQTHETGTGMGAIAKNVISYAEAPEALKNAEIANPAEKVEPPPVGAKKQATPGYLYENAAAVWEIIRGEWNSHNCRFTCDKIYLNLSRDQQERVRGSMATYTPKQMVGAIRKYFEERKANPKGYEYKSFYLFVEKGIEFYAEV